jgi:hypothetical protein
MDWTTIIITAIFNIPAFVLIGQKLKKEKAAANKASVEATDVQVGTSLDLVREMRTDIADLKKRMRCLEYENRWLRNGVGLLIQQLRYHGIEPNFNLDSMPDVPEEES